MTGGDTTEKGLVGWIFSEMRSKRDERLWKKITLLTIEETLMMILYYSLLSPPIYCISFYLLCWSTRGPKLKEPLRLPPTHKVLHGGSESQPMHVCLQRQEGKKINIEKKGKANDRKQNYKMARTIPPSSSLNSSLFKSHSFLPLLPD